MDEAVSIPKARLSFACVFTTAFTEPLSSQERLGTETCRTYRRSVQTLRTAIAEELSIRTGVRVDL